jgi:hypothetical protein
MSYLSVVDIISDISFVLKEEACHCIKVISLIVLKMCVLKQCACKLNTSCMPMQGSVSAASSS